MESKYLKFETLTTPGRKTSLYTIRNKQSGDALGLIYFYPAWRKFVFEPYKDTIFDPNCLTDIIAFMQEAQTAWRNSLKDKKDE